MLSIRKHTVNTKFLYLEQNQHKRLPEVTQRISGITLEPQEKFWRKDKNNMPQTYEELDADFVKLQADTLAGAATKMAAIADRMMATKHKTLFFLWSEAATDAVSSIHAAAVTCLAMTEEQIADLAARRPNRYAERKERSAKAIAARRKRLQEKKTARPPKKQA